jgi:glycerol-3-phosphate acyltransferase PlsY
VDPWLLRLCIFFLVGYALGSLPAAVPVARLCGVSILSCGSGNPGATNVCRCLGRRMGWLVFVLDAAKGCAAAYLPLHFSDPPCAIAGLSGAILGHGFSPLLRFRGGKGVAVTVGGLAVWMPNVLSIGVLTWLAVFAATRFVSLASLCLALTLPLCSYLFGRTFGENCFTAALAAFLILRHRANIRRLLAGTEHRFAGAGGEEKN